VTTDFTVPCPRPWDLKRQKRRKERGQHTPRYQGGTYLCYHRYRYYSTVRVLPVRYHGRRQNALGRETWGTSTSQTNAKRCDRFVVNEKNINPLGSHRIMAKHRQTMMLRLRGDRSPRIKAVISYSFLLREKCNKLWFSSTRN
jgi:hypothetical protein